MTAPHRLIVGISGASGIIYGIRLLEVLRDAPGIETHLVMSHAAKRTALLETSWVPDDIEAHDWDVFHRRAYVSLLGKLRRLPGIWWRSKTLSYAKNLSD